MKVWINASVCVDRFLSLYANLPYEKLNGKSYNDDFCEVKCENNVIHAIAYGVSAGYKYKLNEISVVIW
ncbi:MAG: hypothetical protein JHC26_12830 [Thermofilum sp.]|uniref:hypothetical protein n=1 Tax=Thermofilum sp. TaxID=1961369 RepID=UPI002589FD7F|nr:hypothetical protein [Thermofilum sp.]MCI4409971.1 hypothetical protein [Thermofilum sp.]